MTTQDQDREVDAALDAMFAAARAAPPQPGEALMARILDDAARLSPSAGRARAWQGRARPGWRAALRNIAAIFGGGGPLAGVATAAVAGLAIGFAAPEPVGAFVPGLLGDGAFVDLEAFSDIGALLDPDTQGQDIP